MSENTKSRILDFLAKILELGPDEYEFRKNDDGSFSIEAIFNIREEEEDA